MEASLVHWNKTSSGEEREVNRPGSTNKQQRMRRNSLQQQQQSDRVPQRGMGVAQLERLRLQERLNKMNDEMGRQLLTEHETVARHALLSQIPPNIFRDQHRENGVLHPSLIINNNNNNVGHHQFGVGFQPYVRPGNVGFRGPVFSNHQQVGHQPGLSRNIEHQEEERIRRLSLIHSANELSVLLDRHFPDHCDFCVQEGIYRENAEPTETIPGVCANCTLGLSLGLYTTNGGGGNEALLQEKEEMGKQRESNSMKRGIKLMGYEFFPSDNGDSSSSDAEPTAVVLMGGTEASSSITSTTTSSSTGADAAGGFKLLDLNLKLSCGI